MAVYDLIVWLKDNIQRIISFVKSVFSSISNIASGNIGGAASFIEGAIAKTIPMILSGLAQFLHLGGIAKKIQNVIKKIRKPIDNAINKGIKVISKRVKGWFGKKKPKKGDGKKIKEENKKGKADKLEPKDKKKHKEIAGKIKKNLEGTKPKKDEEFKDFHAKVKKKGEAQEDKYQPQLKKGINLDVTFNSVKQDEKDEDVDFTINIAPNNEVQKGAAKGNSGDSQLATPENKKKALEEVKKITVADINNKCDEKTLEEYKYGPANHYYTKYVNDLKPNQEIDPPKKYLLRIASTRKGKENEAYWIKKQFPSGAGKKSILVKNYLTYTGEKASTTVIPDYITSSEIGDVKDVSSQDFSDQLRAIAHYAEEENKKFTLITRNEQNPEGKTNLSGPLKRRLDINHNIIDK